MKQNRLVSILVVIVTVFLFWPVVPVQPQSLSRFDRSFARLSLENVDFSPLAQEARKRELDIEENELERLVYSNFQFVLHNKLNRRSFLVVPEPDHLILKICELFQLNDRLESLIARGQFLTARELSQRRVVPLIHEIEETAHRFKKTFGQYFVDSKQTSMVIPLASLRKGSDQFLHFLLHVEKIQRELARELTEYFLSPAPGRVSVADYQDHSLGVLAESIRQVSQWTRKELKSKKKLQ